MSDPPPSARRVAAMEAQLAAADGRRPAYFHGLTMVPLLVEGDLIEVEPVEAADVRRFDVVTYRFEDKFPTRRVMEIDGAARTFTIMGDAIAGYRRYEVPFDDVLARVVRRRRGDDVVEAGDLRWRWCELRFRARLAVHERRRWRQLRRRIHRARTSLVGRG